MSLAHINEAKGPYTAVQITELSKLNQARWNIEGYIDKILKQLEMFWASTPYKTEWQESGVLKALQTEFLLPGDRWIYLSGLLETLLKKIAYALREVSLN